MRPSATFAAMPLLLLLLLLASCAAEPAPAAAPDDADVVLVADDLFYEPAYIGVTANQPTAIHLTNNGGIVHDLVLEVGGWESGHVRPGDAINVDLGPLSASTVAWCAIPGHRDAGMELEVVVLDEGTFT